MTPEPADGCTEPPPVRCGECGAPVPRDEGGATGSRAGWLWLLRIVPTALVLVAIGALLRNGGEAWSGSRPGIGIPSLVEPHITADDITAVAEGSADQTLLDRWAVAMQAIVAQAEGIPQRGAFLCVGYTEPPRTRREDWRFGWPTPWAWAVRHVTRDDSIADVGARTGDQPFRYVPPVPRKAVRVLGSSLLPWTYVLVGDGDNEWRLEPGEVRWDEARPKRQGSVGSPSGMPDYRSAALLLSNWSVPLLALLVAWRVLALLPPLRTKGRRAALLLVALACSLPFLSGTTPLLNRGWAPAKPPALGWEGAPMLPPLPIGDAHPLGPWLHRDEVARAIARPADRRAFAQLIARHVVPPSTSRPAYLVAGAGPPWTFDTWSWRSVSTNGFTASRSIDIDMPEDVASLDAGAGPSIRWHHDSIELRWRRAAPGEPSYRLLVAIGPLCWLLVALLASWTVPANLVRRMLRRRARRRFRRGLCPACAHPLPPASPSTPNAGSV